MKSPVAFFIFRRPDTTERVFEAIRQAQPAQLLVVADGPRTDRPGEAEACAATRAIIDRVDWDCQVLTHYAENNLGCRQRVSSGLDWVFQTVDEAIILEDDCLPDPSFFRFCDEMLEQYRDDERVMMVSGFNFLGQWKPDRQSYHFSYYGNIWGWATWKRAWQYYDVNIQQWENPDLRERVRDILCDSLTYRHRIRGFEQAYNNQVDAWSYQWDFARLCQSGLAIVPAVNLIANIGFTADATNTKGFRPGISDLPTQFLTFPLKAPSGVAVDREYDRQRMLKQIGPPKPRSLPEKAFGKIKRLLGRKN